MKFKCSVDISLPRAKVVELFDNPENLKYWQDDFVSIEQLSGTPGSEGSKARINYKKVSLVETIIKRDVPNAFHGSYEGSWGKNLMYNYFDEMSDKETRWRSELDYIEMNGIMMKIMRTLMPSMFQKQTQKWMDQFKAFAENQ